MLCRSLRPSTELDPLGRRCHGRHRCQSSIVMFRITIIVIFYSEFDAEGSANMAGQHTHIVWLDAKGLWLDAKGLIMATRRKFNSSSDICPLC